MNYDFIKRVATVAAGVATVTAVSSVITKTATSNMKLPVKAAVIIGAFVAGSIMMDAANYGIEAQIDELAERIQSRN